MALEAFVRVRDSIIRTPNFNVVDNGIVSMGVVVAPQGPMKLLITSPDDITNNYGPITPASHPSLFNALRLSRTGTLFLSRATNSSLLEGVNSKGELIYRNAFRGTELNNVFDIKFQILESSLTLNEYIKIGSTVFYTGIQPNISNVDFVPVPDILEFYKYLTGNEDFGVRFNYLRNDGGILYLSVTVYSEVSGLTVTTGNTDIDVYTYPFAEVTIDTSQIPTATNYGIRLGNIYFTNGTPGLNPPVGDFFTVPIDLATTPLETSILNNQQNTVGELYVNIINKRTVVDGGITYIKYLIATSGSDTGFQDDPGPGLQPISTLGEFRMVIETTPESAFHVVPAYGAATPFMNVKIITTSNPAIYKLVVDGVEYEFSMNSNGVNAFGQLIYIEEINNIDGLNFAIDLRDANGAVIPFTPTVAIGTNIGYDQEVVANNPQILIKALNSFLDNEDILVDFIADLGIQNVAFQNAMTVLADNQYSQAMISIPSVKSTKFLVSDYVQDLGIDNDRAYLISPNDRTTALTGFVTEIAGSTLAIENAAELKAGNREFASMIGKDEGSVNASTLTKKWEKKDREYLLDFRVNTIISKNGAFYINDFFTAKQFIDVFSEEGNRRLANRIARDVRVIMEQFIGKKNNVTTRSNVIDVITNYFTTFIMSQQVRPDAYQLICDTSNNTDAVIRTNTLKLKIQVRYQNTIKYVDVLNEAYELGTPFIQ